MGRPLHGTTPRYETASSNVLLGVARYGGGGLDGARGEGVRTLLRRGQAPPGRSGLCVHREPSRRPGRGPGSATAGLEGLGSREPARRPARLGSSCPAQPSRQLLASRSDLTPTGRLIRSFRRRSHRCRPSRCGCRVAKAPRQSTARHRASNDRWLERGGRCLRARDHGSNRSGLVGESTRISGDGAATGSFRRGTRGESP